MPVMVACWMAAACGSRHIHVPWLGRYECTLAGITPDRSIAVVMLAATAPVISAYRAWVTDRGRSPPSGLGMGCRVILRASPGMMR